MNFITIFTWWITQPPSFHKSVAILGHHILLLKRMFLIVSSDYWHFIRIKKISSVSSSSLLSTNISYLLHGRFCIKLKLYVPWMFYRTQQENGLNLLFSLWKTCNSGMLVFVGQWISCLFVCRIWEVVFVWELIIHILKSIRIMCSYHSYIFLYIHL